MEGILPALEPSHALAHVMKMAKSMSKDKIILLNLCGRGDKDMDTVIRSEQESLRLLEQIDKTEKEG